MIVGGAFRNPHHSRIDLDGWQPIKHSNNNLELKDKTQQEHWKSAMK